MEPGKWFHSLAVCLEHNDLGRSDWRNAVSFQPQFCHPEPASRGWHVTGLSPMRARLGDALHTRKPEIMGRNKVWTITENGHSVRCVVWYRTGLFILTFFSPPPPSAPSCSFSSFPFLLCPPIPRIVGSQQLSPGPWQLPYLSSLPLQQLTQAPTSFLFKM